MNLYTAYGLKIQSELRFPELDHLRFVSQSVKDKNGIDVVIRFGKIDENPFAANKDNRVIRAPNKQRIFLHWDNLGTILVRDGNEVILDLVAGFDEAAIRLVTLGTVLALLLHQRSQTIVLHASAVVICGKAAIFMGHKGAGKSALAAALHARQHLFLADDITMISWLNNKLFAVPGFPYLKLWPDSLEALGHDPELFPRLHAELEKYGFAIHSDFSSAPIPVGCIYILNHGPELAIAPVSPQKALTDIMPHWYGARFGLELLQALGLSTHFRQCANLVKSVSVCRLSRPRTLSNIMDVAGFVEEHMHGVAAENVAADYRL